MTAHRIEMAVKTVLILAMLLFAGIGFNGYKDIDRRFFVLAMGVDEGKEGQDYEVTFKLAIPQSDPKGGKNEFLLISYSAGSIGEAASYIKSLVDKEPDYGHMKVIVLGEQLAKNEELLHTMDWFVRRRDIQKVAFVTVGSPTAKEVLAVKPMFERLPANAMFMAFGDDGTESPYIVTEYLFDLHRRLIERGIDVVLPVIGIEEQRYRINTAYVANQEGLKLLMSPKETGLFSLMLGRAERATITVDEAGLVFNITADEILLKKDLNVNGTPRVTISGRLLGILEGSEDRLKEGELPKYERALEKMLNRDIVELLKLWQKQNLDPLGLGLKYRAMSFGNANEWKRWQEIYPTVQFEANVKATLETTGIIK